MQRDREHPVGLLTLIAVFSVQQPGGNTRSRANRDVRLLSCAFLCTTSFRAHPGILELYSKSTSSRSRDGLVGEASVGLCSQVHLNPR